MNNFRNKIIAIIVVVSILGANLNIWFPNNISEANFQYKDLSGTVKNDVTELLSNTLESSLMSDNIESINTKKNEENLPNAAEIKIINSDNEGIELELYLNDLIIENTTISEGEIYQRLYIQGGGHIANPGCPEIPIIGKYLTIPQNIEYELEIVSSIFTEEEGYNIYPYQPSAEELANEVFIFEKNNSAYQINSYYPSSIAYLTEVGVIRGHRTELITFCPILFNPVQHKLRIYSKIVVEIHYENYESSDLDSFKKQDTSEKYDSTSFQSFFENLYLNYENPTISKNEIINDKDGGSSSGADYLIITPEQFCDNLIPLVNSKENQGLITKVANFSETGSSLSEIESYIQNAYDIWDIPPSYLLLVGDSNLLPTKYMQYTGGGTLPTDLYYATVDGEDFFPDLFYGRLPVQTDGELDIIVDKILNWVDNYNPADVWRQNVLLSAYYQADRYFVPTSESIRSHLESKGYTCNTVYQLEGSTDPADTTALINYINDGTFFVNHRDHGIADGWQHPEFYTSDVSSLTNVNEYPVVFSIDCNTGYFDGATDCLGEEMLKAENKGAVAYIGATRTSWSGFNDELDKGLIASIWPDYFPGYKNDAGHSAELGAVLNYGKLFMFDKYVLTGGSGYDWGSILYPQKTQNTFEMFHLFGDPQLSLFESDIPSEPYNPSPSDDSSGVNTNAMLNVDVFDPNGDLMNVSFYNALDDSLIGVDVDVSNRRTAGTSWSSLLKQTTYTWYANVTDGTYTIKSPIWEFTTRSDIEFSTSPIIINEICTNDDYVELYNYGPDQDMTGWYLELYDGTRYVPYYFFPDGWIFHSNYVVIIEEFSPFPDTDTILYTGENIPWQDRAVALGLFNKEFKNMDWFQTSDYTMTHFGGVEWEQDITMTLNNEFAYRTDDIDTNKASDWAKDTTGSMGLLNFGQTGIWNAPGFPNDPSPLNGAIDVSTSPTLSVLVSDPDGDPMDVSFYNASDNKLIGIDYDILSGERVSVPWSGLSEAATYYWYAIADNGKCHSYSSIWSFTVEDTTDPTWVTPPADATIELGNPFYQVVEACDPSGVTYSIDDTTNFAIDSVTGEITNDVALVVSVYSLTVTATDPYGNYVEETISITVEDTIDPTWVTPPADATIELGNPFYQVVEASDPSGVTYSIDDATNFAIDSVNGEITNDVALVVSVYSLTVTATDPYGNYVEETISITVQDTIDPTWVTPPADATIEFGNPFYQVVEASDPSGVTYSIDDATNFAIDSVTGEITNDVALVVSVYSLTVMATDPYGNYVEETISITVQDTIDPTWVTPPADATIELGNPFYQVVEASDPSGVTYSIDDATNFAIDSVTGEITNDVALVVSVYSLTVMATDPYGNYVEETISITVQDTIDPTWVTPPADATIELGNPFYQVVEASDPSGVTYSIDDATNFAIDSVTGEITNDVALVVSVYSLTVTATDPYGNYVEETISITVQDTIDPTWVTPPADATIELGNPFYQVVEASDPSGVTYSIDDTTNFAIDSVTGEITNAVALVVSVYSLTVTATDPYGNYVEDTIQITVQDTIDPTWVTPPADATIELYSLFSQDVEASDLSEIAYYWIDDSINFTIDENGLIINATKLSIGIYELEIRAYGPYGHYCTATIKITVKKRDINPYVGIIVASDDDDEDEDGDDSYSLSPNIGLIIIGGITSAIAAVMAVWYFKKKGARRNTII